MRTRFPSRRRSREGKRTYPSRPRRHRKRRVARRPALDSLTVPRHIRGPSIEHPTFTAGPVSLWLLTLTYTGTARARPRAPHPLARARQEVEGVPDRYVAAARAADDPVDRAVADRDAVAPARSADAVLAGSGADHVRAIAAADVVVAGPAVDAVPLALLARIGNVIGVEVVVAPAAADAVAAPAAAQAVANVGADQRVVAAPAVDPLHARDAVVLPGLAGAARRAQVDHHGAGPARVADHVRPAPAADQVAAVARVRLVDRAVRRAAGRVGDREHVTPRPTHDRERAQGVVARAPV